jgi:hypothetical protein
MRRWSLIVGMVVALPLAAPSLASASSNRVDTVPPTTVPGDGATTTTIDDGVPSPECVSQASAIAVFRGEVTASVNGTVRYRVTQMLAGDLGGRDTAGVVDVVYGDEARYLLPGETYIVGAGLETPVDLVGGDTATTVPLAASTLVSTVRTPAPLFAGDAVVGLDDSDVECPVQDDPVRTLLADGSSIDTGVLTPLKGHGGSLLGAIVKPLLFAFLALLLVVALKLLAVAVAREAAGPPRR